MTSFNEGLRGLWTLASAVVRRDAMPGISNDRRRTATPSDCIATSSGQCGAHHDSEITRGLATVFTGRELRVERRVVDALYSKRIARRRVPSHRSVIAGK